MGRPAVLIIVENLPVPLDRRVWQESCALRDAGFEVVVICPRMRGCTRPAERLEGIQIYRHWISGEAGGLVGFFLEYVSGLWCEIRLDWKAWRRHRLKIVHLFNSPYCVYFNAMPFRSLMEWVDLEMH